MAGANNAKASLLSESNVDIVEPGARMSLQVVVATLAFGMGIGELSVKLDGLS